MAKIYVTFIFFILLNISSIIELTNTTKPATNITTSTPTATKLIIKNGTNITVSSSVEKDESLGFYPKVEYFQPPPGYQPVKGYEHLIPKTYDGSLNNMNYQAKLNQAVNFNLLNGLSSQLNQQSTQFVPSNSQIQQPQSQLQSNLFTNQNYNNFNNGLFNHNNFPLSYSQQQALQQQSLSPFSFAQNPFQPNMFGQNPFQANAFSQNNFPQNAFGQNGFPLNNFPSNFPNMNNFNFNSQPNQPIFNPWDKTNNNLNPSFQLSLNNLNQNQQPQVTQDTDSWRRKPTQFTTKTTWWNPNTQSSTADWRELWKQQTTSTNNWREFWKQNSQATAATVWNNNQWKDANPYLTAATNRPTLPPVPHYTTTASTTMATMATAAPADSTNWREVWSQAAYTSTKGPFESNSHNGQLVIDDNCMKCLCFIESWCSDVGCVWDQGSLSCGWYQLKYEYWLDCGQPGGGWKECANSKKCAEGCVRRYMTRYGSFCSTGNTCPHLARIHNGGPNGCSSNNTEYYGWLIARCLKREAPYEKIDTFPIPN